MDRVREIHEEIAMLNYMISLNEQVKYFAESTQDTKDTMDTHTIQSQRRIMDLRLELDALQKTMELSNGE